MVAWRSISVAAPWWEPISCSVPIALRRNSGSSLTRPAPHTSTGRWSGHVWGIFPAAHGSIPGARPLLPSGIAGRARWTTSDLLAARSRRRASHTSGSQISR